MSDALDNRVLGVMSELITMGSPTSAKVVRQLWAENERLRKALLEILTAGDLEGWGFVEDIARRALQPEEKK